MYSASGVSKKFLLDFIDNEEHEGIKSLYIGKDVNVSPLAEAQVLLFSAEGNVLVYNAVYGCLPNGTVTIGVLDDPFPVDWYIDSSYNVRIILDPFDTNDKHVVEDVILTLQEQ